METEVADVNGTNQSDINRRKQAILNGLRMKSRELNDLKFFGMKILFAAIYMIGGLDNTENKNTERNYE